MEFSNNVQIHGDQVPLHRPGLVPPWQSDSSAAQVSTNGQCTHAEHVHNSRTHATAIKVPEHVAIVMDGNGRWANARGLERTRGHQAGEYALMDTIAGAVQAGIQVLSVYAFSTENWKRSPKEVHFLLGYSRDVIHRCRSVLNEWNVRVVWSGREPKLWKSVIRELNEAEELTAGNTGLVLNFCMNYGGQAEIVDAVRAIAALAEKGTLHPRAINAATIRRHLYQPQLPPVDLFIRTGGEQRTSNFLLWQAAYAELMFVPEAWPEFSRVALWRCIENYARRDRRFGAAVDRFPEPVS